MLLSFISYFDKYGVGFSDETLSKLITTPENLIEYTIPRGTQIITGGSLRSAAFYPCREVIKKITFEEASGLCEIEPYGLSCFTELEEIDMSACPNIRSLSGYILSECNNLKTIILPPNLEHIGSGSLAGIGVTRLDFPSTLKTIGGYTGYGKSIRGSKLETITWGEDPSITSIGSCAFYHCSFSSLFIPKSLQVLATECFVGSNIQQIEVDPRNNYFNTDGHYLYNKDMTTIRFSPTPSKGTIILNGSVTSIGDGAFMSNSIDTVILSDNITSLGKDSFMYSRILYIRIPSSVSLLGERTFCACTRLRTVEFLAEVKTIPTEMFSDCTALKNISLTLGVETLSEYCLMNCKAMEYVFVPRSVTLVQSGALAGINPTVFIEFEENSTLRFVDGYLYNEDFTSVNGYIGPSTMIQINASVVTIGNGAFWSLSITSAVFNGSHCTTIGSMAFAGSSIQSIAIVGSVTDIKDKAFKECKQLKSVTFGEGVEIIRESAFYGSAVSSIYFPSSLQQILDKAFADSQLSFVMFSDDCQLRKIGKEAFKGSLVESVRLPKNPRDIGMNAFSGSSLKTISFESPSGIGNISEWAFAGCEGLTRVNFVEGITSIGVSCFEECISLESIELGKDIERISMNAFKGCLQLQSIAIPDGSKLQTVETLAFANCPKLLSFEISRNNEEFSAEDGVLYDYERTQIVLYLPAHPRANFTVPCSVGKLLIYSFQGAENLISIELPEGLSEIGFGAFFGCKNLRRVNIPPGVASVGVGAFTGCTSLGCGSIVHSQSQKQMLLDAAASLEALTPCPTGSFTVLSPAIQTANIMVPALLDAKAGLDADIEIDGG